MASKELVLETLRYINNKGKLYVDVRKFWFKLGLPKNLRTAVKDTLTRNGLINISSDELFVFAITESKGVPILRTSDESGILELDWLPPDILLIIPNLVQRMFFNLKYFIIKAFNNPWGVVLIGSTIAGIISGLIVGLILKSTN